jgi:hypothetical protein
MKKAHFDIAANALTCRRSADYLNPQRLDTPNVLRVETTRAPVFEHEPSRKR